MADDKKTNEQRAECRAALIQDANAAYNRGDFKTAHHITRIVKIADNPGDKKILDDYLKKEGI